jgi:hypothetical protein
LKIFHRINLYCLEKGEMAILELLVKSNHEDGEARENTIKLNLEDAFFSSFLGKTTIDWSSLNALALSYPNYIDMVRSEIRKNKIEVPDPNFWTTEGIVVALNENKIPEEFYLSDIEDRLFTGDLIY